jgi:hypothetical protein
MVNKRLMYTAIGYTLIAFGKFMLMCALFVSYFAVLVFLINLTGIDIFLTIGLALLILGITLLLVVQVKDTYYSLLKEENRKYH